MGRRCCLLLVVVLSLLINQQPRCDTWSTFTNGNDIEDVAVGDSCVWCATTGGLVRWDTTDMSCRKFVTLDGLPSCDVTCVDVAPDGTVWCGTGDSGVARYDGSSWTVYTERDGLIDNSVVDVAVSIDGAVWCAARDGGFAVFDGESWASFTWPDTSPLRFINEVEAAPNGDIWLSGYGLYRYDGMDFISEMDKTSFLELAIGPAGDVWVAKGYNIYRKTEESDWDVYELGGSAEAMAVEDDGTVWIGDGSDIIRFDGEFEEFNDVPGGYVRGMALDSDGILWIGKEGYSYKRGYELLDNGGMLIRHAPGSTIWESFDTSDELIDNPIMTAAVDTDNVIWIGTQYGIPQFDGDSFIPDARLMGYHMRANSLGLEPSGDCWIGNDQYVMRFHDGQITHFDYDNGLPGQHIDIITVAGEDDIWFATHSSTTAAPIGRGVTHYDGIEFYTHSTANGLIGNWVQAVGVAPDGSVWVGAKERTEGIFYKPAENQAPKAADITGGVSVFDGMHWRSYTMADGLVHYDVLAIGFANDGDVWVGTSNGLSRYNGLSWTSFTIEDGLVDNHINSIATEPDGTLWFATDNGASSLKDGRWKSYTTADGLPAQAVGDVIADSAGHVYFLTMNGFSVLDRSSVDIAASPIRPCALAVTGSAPNPFNARTTISFELGRAGNANLSVYNSLGQRAKTLISGRLTSGVHTAVWNGTDDNGAIVSSGVYVSRLETSEGVAARRMLFLK